MRKDFFDFAEVIGDFAQNGFGKVQINRCPACVGLV